MSNTNTMSLFEALALIPDHRHRQGNRHSLQAILSMSVAAMLSGFSTPHAITQWGREIYKKNRDWMRALGFDSYTSPAGSTVHEIFKAIDIKLVEEILGKWIDGLLDDDSWRTISIDGKTLRGSAKKKTEAPGVHLISAYLQHPGCVIAQMEVDKKTNEHKAALELIGQLILKDTVIVGDAMFCQRDLSQAIIDNGGDYLFAVKNNQPALKEEIASAFAEPSSPLGRARVAS